MLFLGYVGTAFIIGMPNRAMYETAVINGPDGGIRLSVKGTDSDLFMVQCDRIQLISLRRPAIHGGGTFLTIGCFGGPMRVCSYSKPNRKLQALITSEPGCRESSF